MPGLRDAINLQQRSLSDLERSRNASTAWSDQQRQQLDRQCLEPLTADGRRLVAALRKAGHEIAAAEAMIKR